MKEFLEGSINGVRFPKTATGAYNAGIKTADRERDEDHLRERGELTYVSTDYVEVPVELQYWFDEGYKNYC